MAKAKAKRLGRMFFRYRDPVERIARGAITATIRPYPRKLYEHIRVYPGGHIATVVHCEMYSEERARQLVLYSGFLSIDEWKEAYKKAVGRPPDPNRDYIIVLKPGW